jgi:hypothetical protein
MLREVLVAGGSDVVVAAVVSAVDLATQEQLGREGQGGPMGVRIGGGGGDAARPRSAGSAGTHRSQLLESKKVTSRSESRHAQLSSGQRGREVGGSVAMGSTVASCAVVRWIAQPCETKGTAIAG